MRNPVLLSSIASLCLALLVMPATAASKCSGSKCASQKAASTTHKKAAPATHKGVNDYTPEQRAKIMERAREVCRQHHGSPSRVYRVDYKRMRVWCLPPSAG